MWGYLMIRLWMGLMVFLNAGYSIPLLAEGSVMLRAPVSVKGSGCNPDSVAITFSPDFTSLSVLFNEFQASAGPVAQVKIAVKRCWIRIPLFVTKGYRIIVRSTDFRGFVQLPEKAQAKLYSRFSLKESPIVRWSRRSLLSFIGPTSQELFVQPNSPIRSLKCGGKLELTLYAKGSVVNLNSTEDASIAVDSIDFSTDPQLALHVSTKACDD